MELPYIKCTEIVVAVSIRNLDRHYLLALVGAPSSTPPSHGDIIRGSVPKCLGRKCRGHVVSIRDDEHSVAPFQSGFEFANPPSIPDSMHSGVTVKLTTGRNTNEIKQASNKFSILIKLTRQMASL